MSKTTSELSTKSINEMFSLIRENKKLQVVNGELRPEPANLAKVMNGVLAAQEDNICEAKDSHQKNGDGHAVRERKSSIVIEEPAEQTGIVTMPRLLKAHRNFVSRKMRIFKHMLGAQKQNQKTQILDKDNLPALFEFDEQLHPDFTFEKKEKDEHDLEYDRGKIRKLKKKKEHRLKYSFDKFLQNKNAHHRHF